MKAGASLSISLPAFAATSSGVGQPVARSMRDSSTVNSVARVFEVLESFRRFGRPMALKQIAAHLRYPSSSTHALLRSMARHGYLSYERGTHMYFPTLRVAHLGDWIERCALGDRVLDAMVAAVQQLTRETVAVSIENDTRMQFVSIAHSDQPLRLDLVPGESAPITNSAVGHALLSTKSAADIRRIVQRSNHLAVEGQERVDSAAMVREAARIRRAGFVIAYHRVIEGTGAVAMPILGTRTGSGMVLAVAGPEGRIRMAADRIVEQMRATMARHFGYVHGCSESLPPSARSLRSGFGGKSLQCAPRRG